MELSTGGVISRGNSCFMAVRDPIIVWGGKRRRQTLLNVMQSKTKTPLIKAADELHQLSYRKLHITASQRQDLVQRCRIGLD